MDAVFWLAPLTIAVFATFLLNGILGLVVRWLVLTAAERQRVNVGWGSDGTLTRLWALSKEKSGGVRTALCLHVVLSWATLILTPPMVVCVFAYVNFS